MFIINCTLLNLLLEDAVETFFNNICGLYNLVVLFLWMTVPDYELRLM